MCIMGEHTEDREMTDYSNMTRGEAVERCQMLENLCAHLTKAATPEMEVAASKYWGDRRWAALSDDPRTWAGVYDAMRAANPEQKS